MDEFVEVESEDLPLFCTVTLRIIGGVLLTEVQRFCCVLWKSQFYLHTATEMERFLLGKNS